MNRKVSKRLRIAAMAVIGHNKLDPGKAFNTVYNELKREYYRKPFHQRKNLPTPNVSHSLRFKQRRNLIQE